MEDAKNEGNCCLDKIIEIAKISYNEILMDSQTARAY